MYFLLFIFLFILSIIIFGLFAIGSFVNRLIRIVKPEKKRSQSYETGKGDTSDTSNYTHTGDKYFEDNEGEYVEYEDISE